MWKLRLYDSEKFWSNAYDGMELLGVVESEPDFENNLLIDGKTYKICASSPKEKVMGLRKIHLIDDEDIEIEWDEDFICPYCKEVDEDAFELSDEGETQCRNCGSRIAYEREVIPHYRVTPVKKNVPLLVIREDAE
ncbi:hypothetical protein ABE354_20330 [Brevibacillus laterosporus]|uniref:hypothetical protein n=1 Tax=Brevibacillus laterosporus TaxID=1465 RepID=UPI003D24A59A